MFVDDFLNSHPGFWNLALILEASCDPLSLSDLETKIIIIGMDHNDYFSS